MKSIMGFMSADHDRLDNILENYRKARSDKKAAALFFSEFKKGLQRHIIWEEEILFPMFEYKTEMRDGPTEVMRTEHRSIKEFLASIHDKVSEGDTGTEALENGMLAVLMPHNDKEESVLYPFIDLETSEKEREDAFKRMDGVSGDRYGSCCG